MRILALYPGMDKTFNDNAHALIRLKKLGADVLVITSQLSALKSSKRSLGFEDMNGVPIHRIYKDFQEQRAWPVKK
jgi:hypothetical protein